METSLQVGKTKIPMSTRAGACPCRKIFQFVWRLLKDRQLVIKEEFDLKSTSAGIEE
jgi:hypothetical protein